MTAPVSVSCSEQTKSLTQTCLRSISGIGTDRRACRNSPELSASLKCESWVGAFESGIRRVKPYIVLMVSGAPGSSLASRQAVAPKSIASTRGSLVLHVWKNVSVSIQRKGRARVSKLLRDNFGRHSGCQRDRGRRMAQIIEPQSWDTRKVDY
jgi:hypothetical protein